MLELVQRYTSVIRFILIFLGSYLVLAFVYDLYLDHLTIAGYHPDFLTHLVARQSEAMVAGMGYAVEVRTGFPEATMHLLVNGQFVARIVEGCNAASIIILFISFMLAFFGEMRTTLLFIFVGSVFIYVTNIVRISLMSIGIYEYPQYAHFLHSIAFPLVIYGSVFLLWVVWVMMYSKQVKT